MVDNFTPIMENDRLEMCIVCFCAVSEFYMHEHEQMHIAQAVDATSLKALSDRVEKANAKLAELSKET